MKCEELLIGIDDTPKEPNKRRKTNKGASVRTGAIELNREDGQISIKDHSKSGGITKAKTLTVKRRPNDATPNQTTRKDVMLLVADFGETFSAVGQSVQTAQPEEVGCEKRFPGCTEDRCKVPTVIAYRKDNPDHPAFKDKEGIESVFGFNVKPDMKRQAFFKRTLDQDAPATEFDNPILEGEAQSVLLQTSIGGGGLQAVKDSLRHLFQIIMDKVYEEAGKDFHDAYNPKVILTHPTAMSEHGRARLRDAAITSGWQVNPTTDIILRSEADCAILAAFVINKKKYGLNFWAEPLKNKHGVTVVDIGGYTTDACTFTVTKIDPQLEVDQLCIPQGGKCGTVSLYCSLYKYLTEIFGKKFIALPTEVIGHGSRLLKDFERELRKFEGEHLDKTRRFRLPTNDFPDHPGYDDNDGTVLLTGRVIKDMMDSCLEYIKGIINHQIEAARAVKGSKVKIIILCGGGSQFPYYYSRIKAFCEEHPLGEMTLLRPKDAQSAVGTGALISGLEQRILGKRKISASYGIKTHKKYESGNWKKSDIFDCRYGGTRLGGFMAWHILKGDVIDPSKPGSGNSIHGYMMFDLKDLDRNVTKTIVIYSYSGSNGKPPDRVEHPAVRKIGSLDINLSAISRDLKTSLKRRKKIEETTKIPIRIIQMCNVPSGLIEFVAKIGQKEIGRYELNYVAVTKPA